MPSPTALLTLTALSLGLLLAHRLSAASRQRRQIDPASMRVHLALQRYGRQIHPGPDGLAPDDLEAVRQRLSWRKRRDWDAALQAYQIARRESPTDNLQGDPRYNDTRLIAVELERLLTLSARR